MRSLLLVGIVLALLMSVHAQQQQSSFAAGPDLPSACTIGDRHFKTTAPIGSHECRAPNVWTPPVEGGGGQAFPVGSVFVAVVSTDPATLLGYGTWQAIGAGRVLVGVDAADADFDTLEETGGAKTHTLTIAEMPAHTHVQDAHNHTQNSFAPRIVNSGTAGTVGVQGASTASNANASNSATTATNQPATAVNQSTGGGGAHNNLQPYLVVKMWKRTA